MTDKENVITHLQIIHTWAEFARERDLQFFTPKHLEDIAQWSDDAIALLKEQEAQFVQNIGQQITFKSGLCPNCGKMLNTTCNKKFCGDCGKAVKWDEDQQTSDCRI